MSDHAPDAGRSARLLPLLTALLVAVACDDGPPPTGVERAPAASQVQSTQVSTTGVPMVDLGTLGGHDAEALGVDRRGRVVGASAPSDDRRLSSHAFQWTEQDGMIDLGTLGGDHSAAVALRDGGRVVGWSEGPSGGFGSRRAFVWTEASGMRSPGALRSGAFSSASDVDGRGHVVGTSGVDPVDPRRFRAFLWTEVEGMRDLGTLGGNRSRATAINGRGLVVGSSTTSDGERHAVMWDVSLAEARAWAYPH